MLECRTSLVCTAVPFGNVSLRALLDPVPIWYVHRPRSASGMNPRSWDRSSLSTHSARIELAHTVGSAWERSPRQWEITGKTTFPNATCPMSINKPSIPAPWFWVRHTGTQDYNMVFSSKQAFSPSLRTVVQTGVKYRPAIAPTPHPLLTYTEVSSPLQLRGAYEARQMDLQQPKHRRRVLHNLLVGGSIQSKYESSSPQCQQERREKKNCAGGGL